MQLVKVAILHHRQLEVQILEMQVRDPCNKLALRFMAERAAQVLS
jgi:hypothetical protein